MSDDSSDEPRFTIYNDDGSIKKVVTMKEALEMQRAMRAKKEAEWRDGNHEFWANIVSLLAKGTDDEVTNLVALLRAIVTSKDMGLGNFYLGWIASHLEVVRNICSSCGVNHDSDLEESLKKLLGEGTATPSEISDSVLQDMLLTPDAEVRPDLVVADAVAEPMPAPVEWDWTVLKEYGVVPMVVSFKEEADGPNDERVVCIRCYEEGKPGWYWPSLEDRMLRSSGVDGCPRCVDKAKNG